MASECAHCSVYACRAGQLDAAPENCPTVGGSFPDFEVLYAPRDNRRMAYEAARVEAEGYCRWTRAREVLEFSRRMGYERIGIAYCADTADLAVATMSYLSRNGLEAVLPPREGACEPRGQVDFLERAATELNVICGMPVADEAAFIRASQAPVTALVARDARLAHNPVAALYTSGSYYQATLYGHHRRREGEASGEQQTDDLDRVAYELRRGSDAGTCRIEEAMQYADRLGATHLGLTFCVGFRHEAERLVRVLEANGFRVTSVCCKAGAVPKEKLGIKDSEKVSPGQPEMICNPVAQAEILNREEVEVAFILGQCVGHDTATMAHVRAPAACLVVKDRVLAHNTAAALSLLDD